MIEVKKLSRSYGTIAVVKDVSFKIEFGRTVGLLGPNGAGKTTIMKMLTGALAPTAGQVLINQVDMLDDPNHIKAELGYLPDMPPLYPDMTVKSYLKYVCELKKVKDIFLEIEKVVQWTDLSEVLNKTISHLSKGFKQRVGLAQALLGEPKILILDEPTVGLDPKQVAEVRQLIQSLKGKMTVLLSTHILAEVEEICDEIILLQNGQVIAHRPLGVTDDQSRWVEVTLARVVDGLVSKLSQLNQVVQCQQLDKKIKIQFSGPEEGLLESISEEVVQHGAGLLSMSLQRQKLEQQYMDLTKKA